MGTRGHGHAKIARRFDVHVVAPGAAQGHQLDALAGQGFKTAFVNHIIDKHTNSPRPIGRSRCIDTQAKIQKAQIQIGACSCWQVQQVVGLCVIDSHRALRLLHGNGVPSKGRVEGT